MCSLELVSKIVSCPSTNRSINKSTGFICYDEIDKSEDLWSVSEFLWWYTTVFTVCITINIICNVDV